MEDKQLDRKLAREHAMGDRIAAKGKRAMQHIERNPVRWPKSSTFVKRAKASIKRPGIYPKSRPISKAGAQSFHFSFTTVSRGLDGTRAAGRRGGESAAHAAYIEREGAAEVLKEKEKINKKDLKDASIMQDYIEREGAAETLDTPETGEHVLASFGNIAKTYEDRIDFWKKLEQAERSPNRHYLHLDWNAQPKFWAELKKEKNPPILLKHIDSSQTKISGTEKEIKEAMKYLEGKKALGEKKAVRFEPGRGGRVQNRIILELPYELNPKDRLNLAKKFCGLLEEKNLPYWAVIHAPDHHNDRRNYHMHIAFAERPAKRMIDPEDNKEKWDFEVIQIVGRNSGHARPKRVFRQPKDRDINDNKLIKKWRGLYAKYANESLKKAGIKKKLDPRRYTEMGINLTPVPRLSPKEYQQEKKGAAKPENDQKILAQWQREINRLDLKIGQVRDERKKKLKRFEMRFDAVILKSNGPRKEALERAKNMFLVAEDQKIDAAANIEATRHVMSRIQSRTIPPLEKTQFLKKDTVDLANSWAAKDIQKEKKQIENADARSTAALTFLMAAERANAKALREDLFNHVKTSVNARIQAEIAEQEAFAERVAKTGAKLNLDIEFIEPQAPKTKAPANSKTNSKTIARQEERDNANTPAVNKTSENVNPKPENVNLQPQKPAPETKTTATRRKPKSPPVYLRDTIPDAPTKKTVVVEPMTRKNKENKIKVEPIADLKTKPDLPKSIADQPLPIPAKSPTKQNIEKPVAPKTAEPATANKPPVTKTKDIIVEKEELGRKPKSKKKKKKEQDAEIARKRALFAARNKKGIGS